MKQAFIRKILASYMLATLLLFNSIPVLAQEAGSQPTVPTPPPAPTAPATPPPPPEPTPIPEAERPTAPEQPQPSPTPPTPPTSPTQEQQTNPAGTTTNPGTTDPNQSTSPASATSPTEANETVASTTNPQQGTVPGSAAGGTTGGDTFIKTGDITDAGNIQTLANTNTSAQLSPSTSTVITNPQVETANTGNGANSVNTSTTDAASTTQTIQNNQATVDNQMVKDAVTGSNDASFNVGDSTIDTGDANVTGTMITAANTNIDGVSVAEFNIVDDHKGDIVLDWTANCISGCGNTTAAANIGNGANSQNTAVSNQTTNNSTVQNNDGIVGNSMTLSADTGSNVASMNTGGDSTIKTGDANVVANALTFLNNNFSGAGQVIYNVVNIFGDLVGDIVMPDITSTAAGNTDSQATTAANTGNGAGSTNTTNITQTTDNATFQTNLADIQNDVVADASTGDNQASRNTGGNTFVDTGNADATTKVVNVANSNISGDGTLWLVIINKAGEWVGKIMGAPEGSTLAGSEGTEFAVDANGNITAVNSGKLLNNNNVANM